MARDPRFDVLFEPVRIGPVTAPNRFYQVPHCTGMGWERPRSLAALRSVKAEGGWGVVSTEYCSIHPSSDDAPYPYASLWDGDDVRAHARMVEAVHAHGALAAVELWHGGSWSANLLTREPPVGPSSRPVTNYDPVQSRAMDRSDIRELRHWHAAAARRAREAGFDIVYVYATHGYLLSQFLSPANRRGDEYGGSLANRVRLVRELIEETREAVGGACAVAVRFAIDDEGADTAGERREMFALLAELPDLWDLNIQDYGHEMGSSRFFEQGSLESAVEAVRALTTKPVVSVGRYTSPDAMAAAVRRGVLDLIGAARPSIADPFLPRKVEEGRIDEIRECIGCNVCYAGDGRGVPIRCTQNPTIGEEWRRGWHPERIAPRGSDARVLVVGAGPAGLEAARALGQRGYPVVLAEAGDELGGRVTAEARLPGLGEWRRVADHRIEQIRRMPNVEVYRASCLGADDVLEVSASHVAIATGARWRRDATGRQHPRALATLARPDRVLTPDDLLAGREPEGPVVIYDDDHYYLGGVLAERLRERGLPVTVVTPAAKVAAWSEYTVEQARTQARLLGMGVECITAHALAAFDGETATLACVYTGRERTLAARALVPVTSREPDDGLYRALVERPEALAERGIRSVTRIGDCLAPSTIAAAVWSGHRYARELDGTGEPGPRRERAAV